MKGKLDEISATDLIQQHCLEKRTARLIIRNKKNLAEIYIKDGNLVHAQMDKQMGEGVIRQVLQWNEGVFETQEGKQPPAISITRFWLNLLLDENLPVETPRSSLGNDSIPVEQRARLDNNPEGFLKGISTQLNGYLGSALISLKGSIIAVHEVRKLYLNEAMPYIMQLIKILPAISEKSGLGVIEEDLFTTESAYGLLRYLPNQEIFLLIITDRSARAVGNLLFFSRTIPDKIVSIPSSSLTPVEVIECLYRTNCPVYQRKVHISDTLVAQVKNQYCQAQFRSCAVFDLIHDINEAGLPINMYLNEIQGLIQPQ